MDSHTEPLRPGDRVTFSKTVLEHLLAHVSDKPDSPEGQVVVVGIFVGAKHYADGDVSVAFRRADGD